MKLAAPNSASWCKIYIFGCGISGMLTALSLAKAGIRSEIIEAKSQNELKNPTDPRTTALSLASKEFLIKQRLWNKLEVFCQDIRDIYVCQRMADNILHIDSSSQELGTMISNNDLRRELFKETSENSLIKIHYSSKYSNLKPTNINVEFSILSKGEKTHVISDLCIGADGKFSEAKELFFYNKITKNYCQKAIVFNIEHTKNHEGGAIEHFLYRGPFATLPLKGGFISSIVWSESSRIADFLITQPYETLEKQIEKFTGSSLGEVKIITKPESYPLSAFATDKYNEGMLTLVADSAHSMHPLAGQGLNMGIKDVSSLTNLIIQYISLGIKPDQSMLAKYQKSRSFDNIAMVKITDTINSIFNTQIKPINKITEIGLSLVNSMPFLKEKLTNYAKGRR